MGTALAQIFSGLWRYLAMVVSGGVLLSQAKRAGKTEAVAEALKEDVDAAKRVAEAASTARPDPGALPERLRRTDW